MDTAGSYTDEDDITCAPVGFDYFTGYSGDDPFNIPGR